MDGVSVYCYCKAGIFDNIWKCSLFKPVILAGLIKADGLAKVILNGLWS